MIFGQKLKELRLSNAEMGLRKFAKEIGMKPSELSKIEHGYSPPPKDSKWFFVVAEKLKLKDMTSDQMDFHILWQQPFVMQLMDEDGFAVHGLMSDGTSADGDKLIELTEYLQNIAKEHNKKARKYNETE